MSAMRRLPRDVKEDAMPKLLVPDELWALVEPLLPKRTPSPKGGHPPVDDRCASPGILFVLKTDIPWEDFPQEMGCYGTTLWNRLGEWRAGVWDALHRRLLDKLNGGPTRSMRESGSLVSDSQ
jgi:transposase